MPSLHRRLLTTLGAVALAALGCAAAAGAATLVGLAPDGWTMEGPVETFADGPALEKKIDGFAELHMSFSLQGAECCVLARGEAKVDVFLFHFDTPQNAYGLYTVIRPLRGEIVPVGDEATYHQVGGMCVWRGTWVTQLIPRPKSNLVQGDYAAIAGPILAQVEEPGVVPALVTALPPDGLQANTIRYYHHHKHLDEVYYIAGNLLRLGANLRGPAEPEGVYAQYALEGRNYTLIAVGQPAAETTAAAASDYLASLKGNATAVAQDGGWTDLTLRNGKHTLVLLSDRWVVICPEAVNPKVARTLIEPLSAKLAEL